MAVSDHSKKGSQIVNPKHLDVVGSMILDTMLPRPPKNLDIGFPINNINHTFKFLRI